MKKRRTLVVAFVLVAALCLGIGYAAVSTTLDINGSATMLPNKAFAEQICFTAATPLEAGNTANVNTNNNSKASFTANNLNGIGNKASFTFTVENKGDLAAKLNVTVCNVTAGNVTGEDPYFKITTNWEDAVKDIAAADENSDDDTVTVTVTVEVLRTPVNTVSGSFLVELTANSVNQ